MGASWTEYVLVYLVAMLGRDLLTNMCLCFLVLEVMQFARDAHLAEGWIITQESYLKNQNLGVSTSLPLFLPFVFSFLIIFEVHCITDSGLKRDTRKSQNTEIRSRNFHSVIS